MLKTLTAAFAACFLFTAAASAQTEPAQSEAEQIARAYMAAYSAADWDAMAPYMADDILFADHTNPDPSFQSELHSRDAALGMLRNFGETYGAIELGFEWATIFESNGVVVFSGFVNSYGAPPGQPTAYRWRAEQVSVVVVADGRVVRHEDFANYAGAQVSRAPRPN
ncbi:MAG: nuclear transport factor 2 family protein [Hyphomonadaceae bacterium]